MTSGISGLLDRVFGEFSVPTLPREGRGPILPAARIERMSIGSVDSLVQFWSNRLRSFRSGDHVDAATLLATTGGAEIMTRAIVESLRVWANSSWTDEAEIRFVAADLAELWPHDAPAPDILRLEDPRFLANAAVFSAAFEAKRREAGKENLADAIASYHGRAIA